MGGKDDRYQNSGKNQVYLDLPLELDFGKLCESQFHCCTPAQSCPTLWDPMDCSLPGSSVMEFSRQEYWSGLLSLLQGIFQTQGSNLGLLHYRQILYHLNHFRNQYVVCVCIYNNAVRSILFELL